MNYEELSRSIETMAGGPENVESFTNCMTRLRLNLVDPSKADTASIGKLDGVLGVVPGKQLQVVVGPGHAERLRDAYAATTGMRPDAALDINEDADTATSGSGSPLAAAAAGTDPDGGVRDVAGETKAAVKSHQNTGMHAMFRHIGNIFVPIIPGFIACGLITAIANIWKMSDPSIAKNPWFLAFAALGGILVGALNFIVGLNTSKEFGGTPVLGFIAGGVSYMPALAGIAAKTAADGTKTPAQPLSIPFFGNLAPGLGGVIGVMITAWLFTVIEKWLRKRVPASLDLFIVPVVTVLIGSLVCIFIIMPLSALLMQGLTWLLVDFALKQGGVIGGFLMGALFLPMVMLGIHQGLTPIHAQLIAQHGYTELLPILAMAGAGQVGMACAVWAKTKDENMRRIIKSALPIGILGIGEPLIYGVSLPLFYPFITACLGGGFGGAVIAYGMQTAGMFGAQGLGLSGLLMLPIISAGKWLWYLAGWLTAVIMGFVLTYFFGFKEEMLDRLK